MAVTFDISPEKEASALQFFYRQFFVTPPPVSPRETDVQGKTAIVTGANVGLGLETARQLLDLGCNLILAVRDEAKGEIARQDLARGRNLPSDAIKVWQLDLSSYDSISSFVDRARGLKHLDIAVLNAGIYKVFENFSPAGYEEGVQINYLSNVLLLISLLPVLQEKKRGNKPGRLVLVSSDTAGWSKFAERTSNPLLPAFKKRMPKWDMQERYGVTKLLGQFFLVELAKRVPASTVTITSANCGMCYDSSIGREGKGYFVGFAFGIISRIIGRTCTIGARTFVHAAARMGNEVHGHYVEDAKLRP
jgi:NAD(P)-dependent dehydrogenase (short-subunit alcohol dehydrogenase family)